MEQKEYFDKVYTEPGSYLLDVPKNMQLLIQKRFESAMWLINPQGNEKLLDIGCGEGFFSNMIADKVKEVVGLDISEVGIKKARVLHKDTKNLQFRVGDANNLPFPEGCFDVISALEILEHLDKPRRFLKECRRVLKPTGALILSTPNRLCLVNRVRLVLGREIVYFGPDHVKEYTIEEVKGLLSSELFEVKRIAAHLIELPIPRFERILPPQLFKLFIWSGKLIPNASRILCLRAEKQIKELPRSEDLPCQK